MGSLEFFTNIFFPATLWPWDLLKFWRKWLFVLFWPNPPPPVGKGLLIHEVCKSHTTTHRSRNHSSGRVISSSHRSLTDNTQHSQQTDKNVTGGIRTYNLSRRAAADLRLRTFGHWDRQHEWSPGIFLVGGGGPERRADKLTFFKGRHFWNLGGLTSWNPHRLSRPVLLPLSVFKVMECKRLVLKLEPKSPISSVKRTYTLSLNRRNFVLDKHLHGFCLTACYTFFRISIYIYFLPVSAANHFLLTIRFNESQRVYH